MIDAASNKTVTGLSTRYTLAGSNVHVVESERKLLGEVDPMNLPIRRNTCAAEEASTT